MICKLMICKGLQPVSGELVLDSHAPEKPRMHLGDSNRGSLLGLQLVGVRYSARPNTVPRADSALSICS